MAARKIAGAGNGVGNSYFYTQAEMGELERIAAATKALRDAGLEVRIGHRLPLSLLEALAATVAEHEARRAE